MSRIDILVRLGHYAMPWHKSEFGTWGSFVDALCAAAAPSALLGLNNRETVWLIVSTRYTILTYLASTSAYSKAFIDR